MKDGEQINKSISDSLWNSTSFKILFTGLALIVICVNLIEHKWFSSAFWFVLLALQYTSHLRFKRDKLVNWLLVITLGALLVIQIVIFMI